MSAGNLYGIDWKLLCFIKQDLGEKADCTDITRSKEEVEIVE